ncbi:outer dense fiber protein 2-like [Hetaerina americana]|uniref:outer dense fiber protein 2-like n=1 Tax=Hetaerina americana TaxID=62018 RepID=UPI003A7F6109
MEAFGLQQSSQWNTRKRLYLLEEQELENGGESVSETEATENEETSEAEEITNELTSEAEDVEAIPDESTTPMGSTEREGLQSDTTPHESSLSIVKEDAEKEMTDEKETLTELEAGESKTDGKMSTRKDSEDERKSIASECRSILEKDAMAKSSLRRAPSTYSDVIFARPSVMNKLNETYQQLYETKSQVDELKKSIEKFKDVSYTEADAKELKEKEKQLFEKLSKLESVTQKLVELGGLPTPECDFSLFSPDMATDEFTSCDKYLDDFKKCTERADMAHGFEKPKFGSIFGDKAYKKTSIFSPKDIRLSQNIPQVTSFLSKAFALPKVVMCRTGKNLPKIVVGDPEKKLNIGEGKPQWPFPSVDASMDPKNEVVICLTDRLKESYSIQDKLVSENVHLEDFQYQLQEEILAKEQALEDLKRKNSQIQNEMKLLVWENKQLQDKLCDQTKQQPSKEACKKKQTKKMEENIINRLEMQMKNMQKELQCVQLARKQAELERCRLQEAASSMRNRPTTSPQVSQDKNCEKIQQLKEKYARVTEDYKSKVTEYLLAQQQVEEQRRQIELMEADNRRITKQVEEEIQRVKCQFQEKLEELKSLPDVLRTTQCRLQEAIQRQKAAEEKCYEFKLEAEDARAKKNHSGVYFIAQMMEATQKLDQFWNQQQDSINQQDSLTAKAEAWEKKCKELTDCNCKLKGEMKKLEECAAQCRRCAEEKSVEILQLSNQLECVREDSARQVARAKERCETIRRSYQCQIEDLERQLVQTRASARAAQAERDETRKRMQCEIGNLSENFEQAQSRIRYLQSHVNYLKKSFSNMLDQSPDNMPLTDSGDVCSCD